jgi:hypothetical protein
MKKIPILIALGLLVIACNQVPNNEQVVSETPKPDTAGVTNNFYDNEPVEKLKMVALSVEGEIANPAQVDFGKLPLRSVIVKEAKLQDDGSNKFIGAYRYDGYSLLDILNLFPIKKKNEEEFPPIIDLYVEISNDLGEKVVLSWGEIFYPNDLHQIIIANSVMRIVPSKTKDLWILPETSRLIISKDLLTERNISNPSKIVVKSADIKFKVEKGMSPMYTESFKIQAENGDEKKINALPAGLSPITYNTIFYGRGRGIHSTTPFTGYELKQVLYPYYKFTKENLQHGLFVVAGLDGYRVALSYSELFNRNDQSEFLLIRAPEDKDGGSYRIFPAADFFSDRAVKSVSEIRFIK